MILLMKLSVIFPILFFAIGLSSGAFGLSKVQSATLAQVGSYVVTSRDVEISSLMEQWFLLAKKNDKLKDKSKDSSEKNNKKDLTLDIKSSDFQKQVNLVIAELLVMSEAENFSVAQTSTAEIQKVSSSFTEEMKNRPEWTRLEVSPTELEQNIGRHLRAKEFLKFKTESMGMQVSDEEAKKFYDQDKGRFNNLPFENFKESIKEYLITRDVQAKMKDWFDVLRKKYKVKILQFESDK